MSEQSQAQAPAPEKPWYMKWWVWLIAVVLVIGGIGALIDPSSTASPAGESTPINTPIITPKPEPSASPDAPKYASRPELERFLAEAGVVFDDLQVSARTVVIYVPTETARDQAQQIANDAMLFLCANTQSPPGFVKTDDRVSIATPGYSAADHPITYAQGEDVCAR
ncbi:hypothetical protein JOD62_001691 [Microbacterium keratanolyticum]|uniref:Uncharacterized protein n=1 Tax=Microbacterium keratanolyticum TaxID=67574 RepID=A0A9W6M871_9MICO|nr:hypothetical protein [Microbacterium keratanolyticum]MBM7469143.1 hypothetical protein [Microbacterium keratanolyticum]GLK01223.1 hypothetical protein GCM10017596_09380 [Microbacterium keratanolyticum]